MKNQNIPEKETRDPTRHDEEVENPYEIHI
jgi:hypothetical protein